MKKCQRLLDTYYNAAYVHSLYKGNITVLKIK